MASQGAPGESGATSDVDDHLVGADVLERVACEELGDPVVVDVPAVDDEAVVVGVGPAGIELAVGVGSVERVGGGEHRVGGLLITHAESDAKAMASQRAMLRSRASRSSMIAAVSQMPFCTTRTSAARRATSAATELGHRCGDESAEVIQVAALRHAVDLGVRGVDRGERPELQPQREVLGMDVLVVTDAAQGAAEAFGRVVVITAVDDVEVLLADAAERGGHQRRLVREVVVRQPERDPGGACDRPHGDAADPVTPQHDEDGVEDVCLAVAGRHLCNG